METLLPPVDPMLLETLRGLECELHAPKTRSDRHRLVALLHLQFREIGRSGAFYTRDDILDKLPAETAAVRVHAQNFAVSELSPELALLTYSSFHICEDGTHTRHTHRSAIWQHGPDGWQMRFHQGTPTEPFAKD
jgi:hypothetical protein